MATSQGAGEAVGSVFLPDATALDVPRHGVLAEAVRFEALTEAVPVVVVQHLIHDLFSHTHACHFTPKYGRKKGLLNQYYSLSTHDAHWK